MRPLNRITLEEARIILEATEAKARELGVDQNIAVVDESGHLVAFHRMDGAKFIAIEIAINKAYTAAGTRKATLEFKEVSLPGQPGFGVHTQHQGRFTILAGGIPLLVGGEVVGAVGVSSGSAQQDQEVAEAGAQAFYRRVAVSD